MQKWEYRDIFIYLKRRTWEVTIDGNKRKGSLSDHMNYLGDQGWELVNTTVDYTKGSSFYASATTYLAVFKRPIE